MVERVRPSATMSFKFPGLLISNLDLSSTELGRGADATVYQAEWNGTLCAAKRLHEALFTDESLGGTVKLVNNFETECVTWSKLRHPNVVQFLGVYLERGSRLPVLIIEKMDTSLRRYLENHSKEEFPLDLKAFVLHQITQALAYLHSQNPPLVHHDLSTNNVLLNVETFGTKLTDFGMSRAINPSTNSRKSSIKGTRAFMPPEALQTPLRYNEKLDIFSFGNVILSTITHEWPQPCPSTRYKGDQLIALDEFQSRERYVEMFTAQEKQLFLSTVRDCLEYQPNRRPSSVMLVQELRHMVSFLSHDGHVVRPFEHLRQELSAKEEECRQKDEMVGMKNEALREKDEALRKKNEMLREKDEMLREKDDVVREKDEALREVLTEKDEVVREKDEALREVLREKDEVVRDMAEALRVKDEVLRENGSTIQELQVEIEQLRHLLVAAQKVSISVNALY